MSENVVYSADAYGIWVPQPGPQTLAVTCPADLVFFGGARGGGKASANSARLLTPFGWKYFSEVSVGDQVINPETGGSQVVLGVFPQGVQDIYRVVFDDGATTHVTLDHYWSYKCANRPRPNTKKASQREFIKELGYSHDLGRMSYYKLGTTEQLIADLQGGKHNPRIPLTAPVMFSVNGRTGTSDLDPYFIGLMLGDGSFSRGKSGNKCASGDEETAAYLCSLGFTNTSGKCDWYLPFGVPLNGKINSWAANHKLLGRTGKDKFIPGYVFTANVEYRLAVLQGLLDSDGSVDDRGHIEFTNVSEHLVRGVADLVRSFGGKASVSDPIIGSYRNDSGERVECQEYRRVYIQSDLASYFFRLQRKISRCVDRWNGGYENMRRVISIEYSHREEATCIKVSSPHGLYITDDYIVTHNTDCAIGKQIIGAQAYGQNWNGLFLRKNFKHFNDLRRRVDGLLLDGLPAVRVGGDHQTNTIKFKNGAQVMLTAIERPEQLDFFQGQSYCLVCIEEACQFPFISEMIDKLKGCLRSAAGVTCQMFLTGNPGGPGHGQIKSRFISPHPLGGSYIRDGEDSAIFIPSNVADNVILCDNDPKYVGRLRSIKDESLRKAWLEGDWNVVLGGFFDDVWKPREQVLPRFKPPRHWPRMCGLDWGSAKPFSVGWYAIADGEKVQALGYALPRGAVVRYDEWYGCLKNEPNVGMRLSSKQVAEGIKEREVKRGEENMIFDRIADTSIFDEDDGPSIGERFANEGVVWRKSDKRRIPGWENMRSMMFGHKDDRGEVRPMFYVTENCRHFIEIVPTLERDENDWEDLDTDGIDHIADEPLHPETLVHTDKGYLPIKDMPESGLVYTIGGKLTPYHSCRVTRKNAELVEIEFTDGQKERCCPTHEFLTQFDFFSAKDLQGHNVLVNVSTNQKESICKNVNTESKSGAKLVRSSWEKGTTRRGTTSRGQSQGPDYTGLYGSFSRVKRYLKDTTFTMRTSIQRTISTRILSLWKDLSTMFCINGKQWQTCPTQTGQPLCTMPSKLPLSGTSQRKGLHGIESSMSGFAGKLCTGIMTRNASSVESLTGEKANQSFAQTSVSQNTEESTGLMTKREYVLPVETASRLTNTQKQLLVQGLAEGSLALKSVKAVRRIEERADVYCMSVPETEVFEIEGGVLTHNCRYVLMSRPRAGISKQESLEEEARGSEFSCAGDWDEILSDHSGDSEHGPLSSINVPDNAPIQ